MPDPAGSSVIDRIQADPAAYVANKQAAGIGTGIDPLTWELAIVEHLRPLPANRWRPARARRVSHVGVVAPAVAERLTPPPGAQPQPRCPLSCYAQHWQDDAALEVAG